MTKLLIPITVWMLLTMIFTGLTFGRLAGDDSSQWICHPHRTYWICEHKR